MSRLIETRGCIKVWENKLASSGVSLIPFSFPFTLFSTLFYQAGTSVVCSTGSLARRIPVGKGTEDEQAGRGMGRSVFILSFPLLCLWCYPGCAHALSEGRSITEVVCRLLPLCQHSLALFRISQKTTACTSYLGTEMAGETRQATRSLHHPLSSPTPCS